MSAPAQTAKRERPSKPKRERPSTREMVRTGGLVVLAIFMTLFAVLNLDKVEVNWIFGSGKAPLIIVIVVSLLVGVLFTHFAERRYSRRR